MGNSITRRRSRRRDQVTNHTQTAGETQDISATHQVVTHQTLPTTMEQVDNSDQSENEMSESNEPQPNLASILSFLLRSGQVRLVRSGGLGAFEVNVHVQREDSDEEDESGFTGRQPPSPRGDNEPDTSNIPNSQLQKIVQNDGGHFYKTPMNLTTRLFQRESAILHSRSHFTSGDRAICTKSFLPNSCETVARYRSKAFCGSYSSDGTVFMTACQDQHIRMYDTTDGQFKLFRNISAKDVGWSIVDTAYSPDQHYIIYSSWSDFIHQCNVYGDHNTHLALDLRPEESRFCAFSVSFSEDSKEIIAGGSDRCLYIYDRGKEDRILRISAHDDDVNAVSFAGASSNILISGGDDGICKVWDRRLLSESTPKPVGTFAGHTDGITYICAKGDENHFISNSKDQTIKLWDTRKPSSEEATREARRIVANQNWDYRWETVPRRSPRLQNVIGNDAVMTYRGHRVLHTLLRAKFSPAHTTGQQFIYAGCATGSVVVYDVLTGKIVTKLRDAHRQCVRDVSWHPYESVIMSTSWDCTIGKWEYCHLACEKTQCESSDCANMKKSQDGKRKRMRSFNDEL